MISGISNIFTLIVNSMFDINDSMKSRNVGDLNANVIELACVCTDDLPTELASEYCKSLEVVYATLVRSILQSTIRNRGNSSPKDLFKSLPILTNFDLVEHNEELNAISSVSNSLFHSGNTYSGGSAVNAFLESVNMLMSEQNVKDFGLEADVFLKETRGGVPTFIDVTVTITVPGGRALEKVIPIGISVRPKFVQPQEMIGFFIKQNNKLTEMNNASKVKAKKFTFKSLFTKNRIVQNKIDGGIIDNNSKRVLSSLLESTKRIDKPFVCLLMSSYTRDLLNDAMVDVSKPALLKNIYNTLPVMSISIYDMSLDMIYYSLNRGQTTLVKATASSFNTDISQLQKTLAEGLRVSKMLS
ncbi:MAG: hypothetical protein ACRCX8_14180 [Sarcina sp.]